MQRLATLLAPSSPSLVEGGNADVAAWLDKDAAARVARLGTQVGKDGESSPSTLGNSPSAIGNGLSAIGSGPSAIGNGPAYGPVSGAGSGPATAGRGLATKGHGPGSRGKSAATVLLDAVVEALTEVDATEATTASVEDGLTVRMAVELVVQWGVVVHLPADVQALSLVTESPLDPAAGVFGLGEDAARRAAYAAWLQAQLVPLTNAPACLAWLTARLAPGHRSPVEAALRGRWLPVLAVAAAGLAPAAPTLLPALVDALPAAEALEALMLALSDAEGEAPAVAALCKRELSRLLHRPDGMRLVVPALLATARDGRTGAVPPAARAGVARLLASVPSRFPNADAYYAQVAPQLLGLLETAATGAADAFGTVAVTDVAATTVLAIQLGVRQHPAAAREFWLWPVVGPWAPWLAVSTYTGAPSAAAAAPVPLLPLHTSLAILRLLAPAPLLGDALQPVLPGMVQLVLDTDHAEAAAVHATARTVAAHVLAARPATAPSLATEATAHRVAWTVDAATGTLAFRPSDAPLPALPSLPLPTAPSATPRTAPADSEVTAVELARQLKEAAPVDRSHALLALLASAEGSGRVWPDDTWLTLLIPRLLDCIIAPDVAVRALAARVLGVYVARHAEAALPRLLSQYRATTAPDPERLALAEAFRSMLAVASPSPLQTTPLVAVLADAAVDASASTVVRTSALAVLAAAAASAHLRPAAVATLRPALVAALATSDADAGQAARVAATALVRRLAAWQAEGLVPRSEREEHVRTLAAAPCPTAGGRWADDIAAAWEAPADVRILAP